MTPRRTLRTLAAAAMASTLLLTVGCDAGETKGTPSATPTPTLAVPSVAQTAASSSTAAPPSSTSSAPSSTGTSSSSAPTSSTVGGSSSATPTAKTSQLPAAEVDGAVTALGDWWTQMEALYRDPNVPMSTIDQYTSGEAVGISYGFVKDGRDRKLRVMGTSTWLSRKVMSAESKGSLDVVRIKACQDMSKLRVVDETGKDVTPKTRNDHPMNEFLIMRNSKTSPKWTVNNIMPLEKTC